MSRHDLEKDLRKIIKKYKWGLRSSQYLADARLVTDHSALSKGWFTGSVPAVLPFPV